MHGGTIKLLQTSLVTDRHDNEMVLTRRAMPQGPVEGVDCKYNKDPALESVMET